MHSKHSTFIAAMYHRYHNLGGRAESLNIYSAIYVYIFCAPNTSEIRKCSANIYLFYRELQMFYPHDHANSVTKISVFRQHLLQSVRFGSVQMLLFIIVIQFRHLKQQEHFRKRTG